MINRVWAMPSHNTLTIKPIRRLVKEWVNPAETWIEPYAGFSPMCEESNDLNPEAPTKYHMDALDFVKRYERGTFHGVIFDPPYSPRQIAEMYKSIGRTADMSDTQHAARLAEVKDACAERMLSNSIAICCGWNTNGFGRNRGFKLIDILIVAHGAAHNDTLVTVEIKR